MILRFTVFGRPEPQGSTRAFIPKGWSRPIITSDNKDLKSWRQEIYKAAIKAVKENAGEIIDKETPVVLELNFYLRRPDSLRKRIDRPIKRPDVSKLLRAVEDSLTGTIFNDDSQVVDAFVHKHFGQPERVEITVATLADGAQIAEKNRSETLALFA